jgi:hypothetical protein
MMVDIDKSTEKRYTMSKFEYDSNDEGNKEYMVEYPKGYCYSYPVWQIASALNIPQTQVADKLKNKSPREIGYIEISGGYLGEYLECYFNTGKDPK